MATNPRPSPPTPFRQPRCAWALYLLTLCALLAACGGGTNSAGGGIGGTGAVAVGTINGFGSVIVNGQEFDDTNAKITVDGRPGRRGELRIGQVVEVRGSVKDGVRRAADITFSSDLRGPIEAGSVNLVANTFKALGALYRVDGTTVYDGVADLAALNTLQADTVVELSGFFDATDLSIRTSRVAVGGPFGAGTSLHVKGTIRNLSGFTFTLGTMRVNANLTPDKLPQGGLKDGLFVEVTSNQLPVVDVGGTLTLAATKIALANRAIEAKEGDDVSVEGLAAGCSAGVCNKFSIKDLPISVLASTVFEPNTNTVANLRNGLKIEVEGRVTNGTLNASKISFQPLDADIRLEAIAQEALGAPQNTLKLLNTTLNVTATTQFEDKTGAAPSFTLTNFANVIAAGQDHVAVKAYKTIENGVEKLVAARVERNRDTGVIVQGAVDEKTPPTLKILGLTVQPGPSTEFKRLDGTPFANATDFFSTVSGPPTPTIVKARGVAGAGTVAVDASNGELEIESP
jgi:Domain of unknown function (DUF5666)